MVCFSYFVYKFDFPPTKLGMLEETLARDVDIIRKRIYAVRPEEIVECTLEEEIKPAPYRLVFGFCLKYHITTSLLKQLHLMCVQFYIDTVQPVISV